MKIRLDYHRAGLTVEVPDRNLSDVIKPPIEPVSDNPTEVVREALQSPLGTAPLRTLARERRSACVVIPDVTRPMPTRLVLPLVLGELERAGIAREHLLILIATGLHRPNEGAELDEMVGRDVAKNYHIENHVAQDTNGHVLLGHTATGVPALVDRRYVESDFKVLLGLVEPHFMAGYSGGRKLICPGICAAQTIGAFHSPDLIEHPRSANCVLDGNPTHETSTEVAQRAGVDFILNVVLDADRRLVAAFAGDLEQAFRAAAARAHQVTTAPIKAPADIVIVTGGGYPLDTTWYQTIKGLVATLPAIRKDGTIILAAGLREGVGSNDFANLIAETEDLEAFMRRIREPGFFRNDQWELEKFVQVARQARIFLYSDGLPRDVQQSLFVTPVGSVEEGIARALDLHGEGTGILVMPHGPYVLPIVTSPNAPPRATPT